MKAYVIFHIHEIINRHKVTCLIKYTDHIVIIITPIIIIGLELANNDIIIIIIMTGHPYT